MPVLSVPLTVLELRRYTLKPGRRDELIGLFENEFIEPQEDAGIHLAGLFRDCDRDDRFVWLRGFEDMDARKRGLETFYGGPVWKTHRDAANATMVDSDDVLLLRSHKKRAEFAGGDALRGPLLVATYAFDNPVECESFASWFSSRWEPRLRNHGAKVLAVLITESAANNFPRLPVRENEHVMVVFIDGLSRTRLLALAPKPADLMELAPTRRSRMRYAHAGKAGDFDFLLGDWNVTHRILRERLAGSTEWREVIGTYRGYSLANGLLSVDEFDFPPEGRKGCSIRHLDLASGQWSIYWTNSDTGKLFAPVRGGFAGDRGEFYGDDVDGGTPVLARYLWLGREAGTPRWEQAFSVDGGATWETNWIMDFARAPSSSSSAHFNSSPPP